MRRTCCLLLALLFCLALLPAARAEAAEDMLEQARQSVVHLYGIGTDRETGQRSRWTGTGFAVGIAGEDTDVFLTNWHVATGSGKFTDGQVELWLLKDDAKFDASQVPLPGCAVKCRVLITTDGYPDVAVIQTLAPVEGYKALPLLSSRRVADGTGVYALGFPGLKGTRYGADSGPEDVSITSGEVQDHLIMTQAGGSRSIIHSAPIQHGFSGGP
ncbi:MAG: serine protease, partial [Faecousia sp.]